MTREVSLKLVYGDKVVIQPQPDHDHAVAAAYAAMIDHFPEEADVFGLPEPVSEADLRGYLSTRGLDDRFGFEIIPPSVVAEAQSPDDILPT